MESSNPQRKIEKSCGAIVFTKGSGRIQYVIVQSKEGIYGFPKGHMEQSETERETALREVAEETGLNVALIDGFQTEDSHFFYRDGAPIQKHIVYFLAQYTCQQPVTQLAELNGVQLMDYDTAINAFQFDSSKRILNEAHRFLLSLGL